MRPEDDFGRIRTEGAGLTAYAVQVGTRRQSRESEIEQMAYKSRGFRHYDAGQNVSGMVIRAHGRPGTSADFDLSYENP